MEGWVDIVNLIIKFMKQDIDLGIVTCSLWDILLTIIVLSTAGWIIGKILFPDD